MNYEQSILEKDKFIELLQTAYQKGESTKSMSADQLIKEIIKYIKVGEISK